MHCLDQEVKDASETSSDRLQVSLYRHEPLRDPRGQIRVLVLLTATEFEDDIHCRSQVVTAPNESSDRSYGEYEALSYAWGDTALTHEIFIEGRRLGVTHSVDTALRHLRYPRQERLLWIDAICINQTDDHEKSHQVQVLHRTFSRAKRVLIWLGPGNKETDYVMQHLEEVERSNPLLGKAFDPAWRDFWTDFDDESTLLVGLNHILRRPWWSRVWTLAEMLVARPPPLIGCGNYWVSNDLLRSSPIQHHRVPIASRLTSALGDGSWHGDMGNLAYLLDLVGPCHATDPRDHIFAITGLFPNLLPQSLLPDYSVSVNILFQRMTVLLLSKPAWLHPTGIDFWPRGAWRQTDPTIPSWCINFCKSSRSSHNGSNAEVFGALGQKGEALAAYGPLSPLDMRYDFDRGVLMLDGFTVGVADYVLHPLRLHEVVRWYLSAPLHQSPSEVKQATLDKLKAVMRKWTERLLTFRGTVLRRLQTRIGKEGARDTFATGRFWQSLMGGNTLAQTIERFYFRESLQRFDVTHALGDPDLDTSDLGYLMEKQHHNDLMPASSLDDVELESAFTDALSAPNDTNTPVADHLLNGLSNDALEALAHIALDVENVSLFVTENGYFGRAPRRAQKGDRTVILSRLAYPVALRPQADGFWQHVSFANVQGIMEGEFVRDHQNLERQEFWLC